MTPRIGAGGLLAITALLAAPSPVASREPAPAADTMSIRAFQPQPACDGVADDSLAVAAALASLAGTGRAIHVPGDCRLNMGPAARLAGQQPVLDGTGLVGEGGRDSGLPYGTRGGTILLTDPAGAALIVKRNARLDHLVFFWPAMTEAAAIANGNAPPTLPPLLAGIGTAGPGASPAGPAAEVSSLRFTDNDVVNAWDVMDFSRDASGALFIAENRVFMENVFLHLGAMPVESFIHDNQFTPNAYFNAPGVGLGTTRILYNWAAIHATDVLATGDGTATASTTQGTVDGLAFHHNTTFGLGYGLRALGGTFNLAAITDNIFDGTPHVMSLEAGGSFNGRFDGGIVYSYTSQDAAVAHRMATPLFYQAPDAAPGTDINIAHLHVAYGSGSLLDFSAASQANATLDDVYTKALNGAEGGRQDAIRWGAGGRLALRGSTIVTAGASPSCLNVSAPLQALMVVGNLFVTCGFTISYTGAFGPAAQVVSNNASLGSRQPTPYGGTLPGALADNGNAWDKPRLH